MCSDLEGGLIRIRIWKEVESGFGRSSDAGSRFGSFWQEVGSGFGRRTYPDLELSGFGRRTVPDPDLKGDIFFQTSETNKDGFNVNAKIQILIFQYSKVIIK